MTLIYEPITAIEINVNGSGVTREEHEHNYIIGTWLVQKMYLVDGSQMFEVIGSYESI